MADTAPMGKDEAIDLLRDALEHYQWLAPNTITGPEALRLTAHLAPSTAPEACQMCKGTGRMDSGGVMPWGEQVTVPCLCRDDDQAVKKIHVAPAWTGERGKGYKDGWNDCIDEFARAALASRPAEVDDEGLPALPEPFTKVIDHNNAGGESTVDAWMELDDGLFTAEQLRQGQRDAVAADRARREKLPANAAEMVAFIGSHYNSMRDDKPDPNDIVYELTVHDLLSAFRWWFEDYELEDEPSHTTNKEK